MYSFCSVLDTLGVPEGQRALKAAKFGRPGAGLVKVMVRLFGVRAEEPKSA